LKTGPFEIVPLSVFRPSVPFFFAISKPGKLKT
jgi:hypothetical protein